MASLLSSSRIPQCMACLRRATVSCRDEWLASTRQQVRGKKKLAKRSTIKVRLLADIPQYGRQGTILSIAAGRMRNEFYPKKMAEYMTTAQLREMGMEHAVSERDSTFRIVGQQPFTQALEEPGIPVAVDLDLLKPERATKILSMLLPPNIDFYRTPVASTLAAPQRHSPSIPAISALSAAAQETARPQAPQRTSIYGSVTTADIAESLRAILAEDDEGARVVLTPEDIAFVEEGEEKGRIKHLGMFEIVIRVKGATDEVRRTIKVNAQE